MMRALLAVVDRVSVLLAAIAALLTVTIGVMILGEVVARAVFNYSLSFAWEYSAYAMGVAMFCGAAFTLRTGGHIRVSLLASHLPPPAAKLLDVACTVFAIGIAGYMTYALGQLAWDSFERGSTSATISATPLAIPQGAITLGAALLTVQLVARLVRLIIGDEPELDTGGYQVD